MGLAQIIKDSEGYCRCDEKIRWAIGQAILRGAGEVLTDDGDVLANVTIDDDRSQRQYNAENTECCIATVTPADGSQPITLGYYSDGAQHALDIVPASYTVQDWSADWDSDGTLPQYLLHGN